MKKLFFLLLLIITSCSYQGSKNRISVSSSNFDGGIKNKKEWDESLKFKRISWYTGASLTYDLLIAELKADSNFRNWLSEGEEALVKECNKLFIGVIYSNVVDARSIVTITSQIEAMGTKRLTLPVFSRHLKGHASFPDRNLDQHRIIGFCSIPAIPKTTKVIEIPGFVSTKLKL